MSTKVYCNVCATFIPSAALVEGHNKGKKHQRLLKIQEEKEKAGKRSVYVRNFDTSATIEEDLQHHFSHYGDVKNVFLDKEQGMYAIVEFELENSVAKVLGEQDPPPLKGKKLRVKARTVPKGKKPSASRCLSPSGRKPHSNGEQELASFLGEEVITKLRSASLVSEQVSILVEELRLTADDLKLRQLVCDLLQEVFKEVYPKVQVVPFGSTMTGLGWKGCDLDLCLVTQPDGMSKSVSMDVNESVDRQKEGDMDYSLIIEVLRSLAPGCVHIIPVLSAKCPLVKFTHEPSGLACDLSINNRLGIHNSELLKCYMSMDPRVIHLVFAVRAWAKAKGVCEKGQLSNYTLTLMVLYFLQTTTPPIIPSLQDPAEWSRLDTTNKTAADVTQKAVHKNDQMGLIVDGWDCAYLADVTQFTQSKNIKTLDQLLEDFFNFYGSEFDYGNCVVNIRRGKRTTVSQVLQELNVDTSSSTKVESSSLPPEHAKKPEFKVTPLCVQDPFELTHNVAQNISVTALKQFIQHAMEGKIVCKNFVTQKNCKGSFLKLLSVSRRAKRKKSPSYSFFVPFHGVEKDGECSGVDSQPAVTNTEGMFCSILKILQDSFGVVCEVTSTVEGEPAVKGTKVPSCKDLGSQKKEQVLHCSKNSTSTSHPEKGEDGSPATCGAKRKAITEKNTMENPAKKLKCDYERAAEDKHEATCTAQKNTWKSHRREKRQHKTGTPVPKEKDGPRDETTTACKEQVGPISKSLRDESGSNTDSHNTCNSSSPVIVFKLAVSACGQQDLGCSVSIEGVFTADSQVLGNFFGVFKKHVTSHLV